MPSQKRERQWCLRSDTKKKERKKNLEEVQKIAEEVIQLLNLSNTKKMVEAIKKTTQFMLKNPKKLEEEKKLFEFKETSKIIALKLGSKDRHLLDKLIFKFSIKCFK